MNGLNDQIRQKIMKQKMVGHESAAIVTYEELEEWANKSDELVKNCSIPDVSQQRELLLAFAMRELKEPISDFNKEGFEKIVDEFLANNCG